MRRSVLFSIPVAAAAVCLVSLPVGNGQETLKREGDGWVRTFSGTAPAEAKLRIVGHGPVTVEGGVSRDLAYTVTVKVMARSEGEARRKLARATVQFSRERGTCTVNVPGGEALSTVNLRAPSLSAAVITTSDGKVDVRGIDGSLQVHSRAGELFADRIHGDCELVTGGGIVSVGQVDGNLQCSTGAGRISVKTARGQASLITDGGDISADAVGGEVTAQTRGGGVHIGTAGGAVTAISGGGVIVVDHAAGQVSAQNMAGPVRVSGAMGVHCESTGAVSLSNVSGAMSVSTAMGSIFANLLGSRIADSFLATGNGDITVIIPPTVGVTIRAANQLSDSMKRIVSDFPSVQVGRRGTMLVAEGRVNGGGPLLQIRGTGGTIYLKRQ
ncbi:MAG TPA: hypothetical protein VG456_13035 [Candidatus Sulfopaludibacter sp.]|jgi:DUF4097 and DUF4098 domain-containing protein YvlB|nr:hypothetical protein [Candidatus Sulfopaludibacter sp.]